jgi:hypothetical protein
MIDFTSLLQAINEPRARRGRPPRDSLDALRTRIWYWHVKIASGMTDYALNDRFFSDGTYRSKGEVPTKRFERIRRRGVVPRDAGPVSLIGRVDQLGSCRGTASIFRSRFWKLLEQPKMELRTLKSFIHEQALVLGLSRFDSGPPLTSLQQDLARQEGIDRLVATGSLDAIALLGALYKEALFFSQLEIAISLRKAFLLSVMAYHELLQKHASDEHIRRFAKELQRDAYELHQVAINRVLFPGREDATPGEHAEVQYPFVATDEINAAIDESSL